MKYRTLVLGSCYTRVTNRRVKLRGANHATSMTTQPRYVSHSVRDLSDPTLFFNRELSWLEFNPRVLDQALDEFHPLLERVKFLAITGSNLDEFFMVRVATHLKKQRSGIETLTVDGL